MRFFEKKDDCHAEACWRSYAKVLEWHEFFGRVRYSTKGLWLALKTQDARLGKDEEESFAHYSLFRDELAGLLRDILFRYFCIE